MQHSLSHSNCLGIDDQFLGAEAGQEVEHPGPRDHIDPGQGTEHGGGTAFHPGLIINHLGIASTQICVRREAKGFAHLGIGGVDHGGFDSAHWGGALAHIHDGGRSTPHDWRAGFGELVNCHPTDALGRVLDD